MAQIQRHKSKGEWVPCTAQPGNCPIKGEDGEPAQHITAGSEGEMQHKIEAEFEKSHNTFGTVSKSTATAQQSEVFENQFAASHRARDLVDHDFPSIAAYGRFTEYAVEDLGDGKHRVTTDSATLQEYAEKASAEYPGYQQQIPFDNQFAARQHARDAVDIRFNSLAAESHFTENAVQEHTNGGYVVSNDNTALQALAEESNATYPGSRYSIPESSVAMKPDAYDTIAATEEKHVLSNVEQENYNVSAHGDMLRDTHFPYNYQNVPDEVFQNAKSIRENTQQYHFGAGESNADELRSAYMVVNVDSKGNPGKGHNYAVYHAYGAHSEVEAEDRYEQLEVLQGRNKAEKLANAEHLAKELHQKERYSGSLGDANEGEFWDSYKKGHLVSETENNYGYTLTRPASGK